MADDERLIVSLEARIRDFERNMQKAAKTGGDQFTAIERRAKQSGDRIERSMSASSARVGAIVKNLGVGFAGGIAGALTVGGIENLISGVGKVAEGIAKIGDEAKRAGLSAKTFQELAYVAEQNRIGVDSLVDGMKELNLRADEWITTGSGPAAEAFKRLGYDANDLKEKLKDPSALFTEIIGKLGQLDKAAQIRVADEVFGGTAGERFVELVSKGERGIRAQIQAANDLGVVLDDEVIRRADELDKKFNQLTTVVGTRLKAAILDAANSLSIFIDRFQKISNQQESTIDNDLADIGKRRLELEQRLIELRGKRDAGETGVGDGIFGTSIGETDIGEAIGEVERAIEALAAEEYQIMRVVQARQTLAATPLQGGLSSSGGRVRYRSPALELPSSVGAVPQRRVDPYFDDGEAASVGTTAGKSMAEEFIRGFEGFRTTPYWDTNAFRVGYGSDTKTSADGSVSRVGTDTTVTLADANRDLARRIGEFQRTIESQIGASTFQAFSEEQKAALSSVAYNYGSLPDRIVQAILNGSDVGAAIRGLGSDNGGINAARRNSEAAMFEGGASSVGNVTQAMQGVNTATGQAAIVTQQLQERYTALGSIGVTAVRGLASALADGKLEGNELLQIVGQIIQQLISMPAIPTGAPAGTAPAGGGLGFFTSIIGALFGGFSEGGYTGQGGKYQPAGVVHRGEYVFDAAATDRIGVGALEAIRSGRLPGFATGGLVGGARNVRDVLGRSRPDQINGNRGGAVPTQTFEINAPITVNGSAGSPEQNADLAKKMAREFESTVRGVIASEIRAQSRPGNTLNRR